MGRLCARRHWHWALCFIRYIYIPLADLNVYYIHTSQTTRALTDGSFRRHRTKFCCNFAAHHFAACICSCMVLLVVLVYIYSSSGGGQKRRARLLVVFGARKTAIARCGDADSRRHHVPQSRASPRPWALSRDRTAETHRRLYELREAAETYIYTVCSNIKLERVQLFFTNNNILNLTRIS